MFEKEAFVLYWLLCPCVSAKYGETSRSQWQMQIMQNFNKDGGRAGTCVLLKAFTTQMVSLLRGNMHPREDI